MMRLCMLVAIALLATACGRAKTPASTRAAATTIQAPARSGLYAAVAADSSVRLSCVRFLVTPSGQDSCIKAEYPLDTMVRLGFGNFAPLPLALRRCAHPGSVDTLVYGRITEDRETGDYTGSEFTFQLVADSIRGSSREGEGGISGPMALQGLRAAEDSDAVLKFWTTGGGRTKLDFRAVPTCASLRLKFRFVEPPYGADTATVSGWYSGKPLNATRPKRSTR